MIGQLDDRQRAALAPHVAGRVVHDLGAGRGGHADELLTLGAAQVEAVDAVDMRSALKSKPCVRYRRAYFKDYRPESVDVAFVSWPQNNEGTVRDLLPILERAATVVYLGKNTDGTMCGTPRLFRHLVGRALLDYVPARKNVLAVYGASLGRARAGAELRQEERAGLSALAAGEPWEDYAEGE